MRPWNDDGRDDREDFGSDYDPDWQDEPESNDDLGRDYGPDDDDLGLTDDDADDDDGSNERDWPDDEPVVDYDQHWPDDEPVDYDQHDRNAAASERLDNLRNER